MPCCLLHAASHNAAQVGTHLRGFDSGRAVWEFDAFPLATLDQLRKVYTADALRELVRVAEAEGWLFALTNVDRVVVDVG